MKNEDEPVVEYRQTEPSPPEEEITWALQGEDVTPTTEERRKEDARKARRAVRALCKQLGYRVPVWALRRSRCTTQRTLLDDNNPKRT